MIVKTTWKCPKCRHENNLRAESDTTYGHAIEYCDVELGGCDRRFVIDWRLSAHTDVCEIIEPEREEPAP